MTPTLKEVVIKTRRYSVGYLPNNGKPNPSPQLILSGKWLKEMGFEVRLPFEIALSQTLKYLAKIY